MGIKKFLNISNKLKFVFEGQWCQDYNRAYLCSGSHKDWRWLRGSHLDLWNSFSLIWDEEAKGAQTLTWFGVEHCDNWVFLGQNKCATDLLCKSGIENCKPSGTLIEVNSKLSKDMEAGLLDDETMYRIFIDGLIYLALTWHFCSWCCKSVHSES